MPAEAIGPPEPTSAKATSKVDHGLKSLIQKGFVQKDGKHWTLTEKGEAAFSRKSPEKVFAEQTIDEEDETGGRALAPPSSPW